MKDSYTLCVNALPIEDGPYLCVSEPLKGTYLYRVKRFAHDLYKVDDWDFADYRGVSGWYDYDSEYGYWIDSSVVAWMKIPEFKEG